MHKEIGDAVAKLYTQARDAGALPRILKRAGVQRETVQVQGRFQIESGSCLGLKFWPCPGTGRADLLQLVLVEATTIWLQSSRRSPMV